MIEFLRNVTATAVIIVTILMLATATINMFFRVPYVPSNKRAARKMIQVAGLKKGDIVYDLGCGDGRLLFKAEKEQAVTKGYEAAPIPYLIAQFKKLITGSKTQLFARNFFKADLKDADVIFCYLGPETMSLLYKKLKDECKKGTRIISNTFTIHGIEATKVWPKDIIQKTPSIYLYEL